MITELQLQHLWFEHQLPHRLATSDGQSIQILQTGWWNHEPGPDFRDAAFQDSTGTIHHGDIEFHINASDWKQHRHHLDPRYNQLILHIAWHGKESIQLESGRRLPTLCLSDQLPVPLAALIHQLPETTNSLLPLATSGICSKTLKNLSSPQITQLLQEAGWHRLHLKANKISSQIQRDGFSQTLWESLAETLGYKENKIPFRLLARLCPIAKLKKLSPRDREAMLFGTAGFLPTIETTSWKNENKRYIQSLWRRWWALKINTLPLHLWHFQKTRPINHPQRRLAALTQIAQHFNLLKIALENQSPDSFAKILASLQHPFFSCHATLKSKALSSPIVLIGKDRIHEILINLVFPWLIAHNYEDTTRIEKLKTSSSNLLVRLTTQRLFSNNSFKPHTALEQQGLLQIFHSFCAQDRSNCQSCRFPQLVEKWSMIKK
ncbi:MAG: DUF2851 family protein [Verrucomicrobiae bacterium]|nr:DUF2851 family protein [Verrucomicrobiae bacterium]